MEPKYKFIGVHPALASFIEAAKEHDKEMVQLRTILSHDIYCRIIQIVEKEPIYKQAAFYGTITEAALFGEDFSKVKTIQDIAHVYANYLIKKTFGKSGEI